MRVRVISLAAAVLLAGLAAAAEFPPETNYDTSVGPDEALVNLRIRNSRWPDCYSLETCIRDIFRLEGVDDTSDATEAKAMALWKWLHMLKSTGGSRVFEGNPYGTRRRFTGDPRTDQIEIRRGDKQLLVYGVHECGGMSPAAGTAPRRSAGRTRTACGGCTRSIRRAIRTTGTRATTGSAPGGSPSCAAWSTGDSSRR